MLLRYAMCMAQIPIPIRFLVISSWNQHVSWIFIVKPGSNPSMFHNVSMVQSQVFWWKMHTTSLNPSNSNGTSNQIYIYICFLLNPEPRKNMTVFCWIQNSKIFHFLTQNPFIYRLVRSEAERPRCWPRSLGPFAKITMIDGKVVKKNGASTVQPSKKNNVKNCDFTMGH